MLDDTRGGIYKFIFERLIQIHDEIIFHDPEYRKLGEESQQLMKELNEELTPAGQERLDRFDCSRTEQRRARMS